MYQENNKAFNQLSLRRLTDQPGNGGASITYTLNFRATSTPVKTKRNTNVIPFDQFVCHL